MPEDATTLASQSRSDPSTKAVRYASQCWLVSWLTYRDALSLGCFVGFRIHNELIRHRPVRDPHLVAIQNEVAIRCLRSSERSGRDVEEKQTNQQIVIA